MLDNRTRILGIIVLILGFIVLATRTQAQIVQQGKHFIEQKSDSTSRGGATITGYIYTDKKGVDYPIYLSSKGNAFIIKVSQKTGKKYRKYLPEVTAKLGTKKSN